MVGAKRRRLVVRLRHAAIRKEEIKNKLGSEPVLANTDVIVAVDDKCVVLSGTACS